MPNEPRRHHYVPQFYLRQFACKDDPNKSQPGVESVFGEMFSSLRTWWLTLDAHCGALIVAGGPAGFSNRPVPPEFARTINQVFLVQLLHGEARYPIGDDTYLEADFEWAGFAFSQRTTHGVRYRATTWKDLAPRRSASGE